MADEIRELFAEYADAFGRGERPRAEDFLARAGKRGDELAAMLERFLVSVPPRPAAPEDRELLAAWLDTPLLELRKRRRLRVDDVVDALVKALGITEEKRRKLRLYYQRLENGTLDPHGVSVKVWEALEQTLGGKLVPPPVTQQLRFDAEVAFFRTVKGIPETTAAAPLAAAAAPDDHDEVDELFLGSPGS